MLDSNILCQYLNCSVLFKFGPWLIWLCWGFSSVLNCIPGCRPSSWWWGSTWCRSTWRRGSRGWRGWRQRGREYGHAQALGHPATWPRCHKCLGGRQRRLGRAILLLFALLDWLEIYLEKYTDIKAEKRAPPWRISCTNICWRASITHIWHPQL